jgi:SAM-dependent methyltransferase
MHHALSGLDVQHMSGWRDFWNGETPIYVNERHRQVHYQRIAADLCALVEEYSADRPPVVMDHGCGQALFADRVAEHCERLILADGAPTVVLDLRRRFAAHPRIRVTGDGAAVAAQSLDLIIVNSVVQYMSQEELVQALRTWRAQLRPGGRLVIADLIPPRSSAVTDASALLRFGLHGGFLLAACRGLMQTAFSDYSRMRRSLGLTRYELPQIRSLLAAAGFAESAPRPNLGHNPARFCVVAR